MCVYVHAWCLQVRRGCQIPWNWSWVAMWVLGIKPVSSARTISALNGWAISSAPTKGPWIQGQSFTIRLSLKISKKRTNNNKNTYKASITYNECTMLLEFGRTNDQLQPKKSTYMEWMVPMGDKQCWSSELSMNIIPSKVRALWRIQTKEWSPKYSLWNPRRNGLELRQKNY